MAIYGCWYPRFRETGTIKSETLVRVIKCRFIMSVCVKICSVRLPLQHFILNFLYGAVLNENLINSNKKNFLLYLNTVSRLAHL